MQNAQRAQIICLVLAAITLAVFSPATHFAFLNCDDQTYVVDNTSIHNGVTGAGVIWALKSNYASNWHPLTWVSHMLDCDLFGSNPRGHHLTNVLLHAANSVLLFLVLLQLTGALWRSAFVAALFAWHPVHVESVAWVSERKDVLSTLFALLAIAAYARYVKAPKVQSPKSKVEEEQNQKSKVYYSLSLLFFAFGLMSKPMVVTLPCLLLLLDFWPLQRISSFKFQVSSFKAWRPLLLEKIPFFAFAALDCIATVWAQRSADSVVSFHALPLSLRLGNALVSYARYLGKIVWPTHLSVFYPYPDHWNLWAVVGAGLLLLVLSIGMVARARQQPFLAVGWLWFLGALVPVIGVAQVGPQAMADRYAYLPSVGVFVLLSWSLGSFTETCPRLSKPAGMLAGVWLIALILCTRVQLQYWRDSGTLFSHALAVTPDNIFAEYNLGQALDLQGNKEEAAAHYARALALRPRRIEAARNSQYAAHYNWGIILANQQRKFTEAEAQFRAALRAKPDFWQAHESLGEVLLAMDRLDEAVAEFRTWVRQTPSNQQAWQHLGTALERQGKGDDAAKAYEEAARLTPSILAR